MRGAVAFALILSLSCSGTSDSNCHTEITIIKSSILVIVLVTTVVLGAIMPSYINLFIDLMNKNTDTSDIAVVKSDQ